MNENTFGTRLRVIVAYFFARWWVRIIVYIVIFYTSNVFQYMVLTGLSSNAFTTILTGKVVSLAPIYLAFLLEYCRIKGNYKTLGFSISKFTLREVIFGSLAAVLGLGLFIVVGLLNGVTISVCNFHTESIIGTLQTASIEEIGFRGIIFRAIEQRFGGVSALIISSLLFAFAHFYPFAIIYPAFINITLAGVVLGAMYMLTRSLWMPIAFHATWNFIEYSIFGRSPNSIIFDKVPENIRGLFIGEYGIEQGLCITIVLLLIVVVVPKITTVSPYAASALFKQQFAESKLITSYNI